MSIKPGIKTTEFWLTIATHAAWIVALVFHRDVSAYVPAVAMGLAAVATFVYAIARSGVKRPHNLADVVADAKLLEPALVALLTAARTELATVRAERSSPVKSVAPKKATSPPPAKP